MKHVIVIGGGIAGLAVASELRGCRVTLVEAKDRFGGRIHTVRTPAGVVELGAEFVHGKSPALVDLLKRAGLNARPTSDRNQSFESGKLHPVEVWDQFHELTQKIDPRARDEPFAPFLDRQGLDERTRRMMLAFAEGFNAADANRLSTHALLRAEYASEHMSGDEQSQLDQGYGAVIDHLLAQARNRGVTLLSSTPVERVHWSPGRVDVHTAGGRRLAGNAAVITLPLGVLKAGSVQFEPAITEKSDAITGLAFGHVVKITLVFRRAWWPETDFGFIHALDEPIVTWWSHGAAPMVTGWCGGPKAESIDEQSPDALQYLAVGTLARLFSTSTAAVQAELVSAHTFDWSRDPHVRGAYSYIPSGGVFLPKLLGAPVADTLFFAGEATAHDAQMGTVFGALESGLRVVREIEQGQSA